MQPEKIEGATVALNAPVGWDEERDGPCGVLWVRREEPNGPGGNDLLLSQWMPSDEERKAIARGAPVMLGVVGRAHPPVSLEVGAPPSPESPPHEGEGPAPAPETKSHVVEVSGAKIIWQFRLKVRFPRAMGPRFWLAARIVTLAAWVAGMTAEFSIGKATAEGVAS